MKREENENWATPAIWENDLRTEIVTNGRRRVRSYDLDGKLLWEFTGMTGNVVPTPFSGHGLLYLSSGYPGAAVRPVYAVRPGAAGDITLQPGETSNRHVAWFQPLLGTYQTSALVYGDYYYTLLDRGLLLCHDAKTGKQMYGRQRIAPEAGAFTASPWAYNGKVFVLSEDGDTFVVQAGPEFKLLGKNTLNEMALASPAVARGSLFLRTQSALYRISRRAGHDDHRTVARRRPGAVVLECAAADGAGARRRADAHPHAGGHDSRARRSHQGPGSVRVRRRGQDARDLRRLEPCGSAARGRTHVR